MSDQFIALLEVELDQSTYNRADQLIKQIAKKHTIELDTKNAREKLVNLNKQLENVSRKIDKINGKKLDFGTGKSGNMMPSIGIDADQVKKVTEAFNRLSDSIDAIHKSIGTLDDASDMQSIIGVANQMGKAFSEMEQDIRQAVKAMKDFKGFNFNINSGSGKKNPIAAAAEYGRKVRNQTIPELQNYVRSIKNELKNNGLDEFSYFQEQIVRVFDQNGDLIGTKIQHFDNETRAKLKELNDNWRKAFSPLSDKSSLEEQMQYYRRQIEMLQELASIRGVNLSGITSQFGSAEQIIQNTSSILNNAVDDAEKSSDRLKNLFGGMNAEEMRDALLPLSDTATEIKNAIDLISKNADFSGLNQQISTLSENLSRIEQILSGLGQQMQLPALAQSFTDLAQAIHIAMNACNNIANNTNTGNQAMSRFGDVLIDASAGANELTDTMRRMDIQQNDIDAATQQLNDMNITVVDVTKNIRTLANGMRQIDFTIRGVDQYGEMVTATQRYRQRREQDGSYTPEYSSDVKITQQVGQMVRPINEVNEAYKETIRLRKQMDAAQKTIAKSDPVLDAPVIENARRDYTNALQQYQAIIRQFWQRFTEIQQNAIRRVVADGRRAIDGVVAHMDAQRLRTEVKDSDDTKILATESLMKYDENVSGDLERIAAKMGEIKNATEETRAAYERYMAAVAMANSIDENTSDLAKISYCHEYEDALRRLEEQIRKNINAENAARKMQRADYNADSLMFEVEKWEAEHANYASQYAERLKTIKQHIQECDAQTLSNVKAEFTAFKNEIAAVDAELKQQNKIEKLQVDKNAFSASIDVWSKKNSVAAEHFKSRLDDIKLRLKDCDAQTLSKLKVELTTIKREAEAAGLTVKSFGDEIKDQFNKIAGYFTLDFMIDRVTDALREMYQQVLEVDTAMTELLKVTDESSQRYEQFMKNASGTAKELGRSMSGYIQQTAEWAKAGYNIDQSEQLAKVSSIYANVGDVDDSTAVSDMVTAMKAYGIAAEDAIRIVDTLNKLGNEFAVTAKGLGEGMANSASAMALSNTTFEQTMALLTGIAEITQSPAEAGSFLKVASMRIRGMKGELEALGEEVDSSVDSISKVQTQILNLTHGEVNIFDGLGQFRNYYEIMQDIADVYDELSSTEQSSLTEILFGKMRGNQGAAMIQAFKSGQIAKAFDAAKDSAGSAMAEQEKWMESLEARLGKLSAAWQSFSESVLSSDFLRGLIDTATGFLNIVENIIDRAGVLPTIFVGGSTALSLFKNVGERTNQFRSEIHIGMRICPRNLLLMVT